VARILILAITAALLALPRQSVAAALPEAEVKAAFVVNFLLFTNWPGSENLPESLRLCVLGRDGVASALRNLDGHRLGASTVRVTRLREFANAEGCHALYLGASEKPQWPLWLAAAQTRGALSIVDGGEDLSASGSILVVAVIADRVAFDINQDLARQHGLSFSSRILQLAQRTPPP